MAQIEISVPWQQIHNQLKKKKEYVNHVYWRRRQECILAAGETFEDNGYLPDGTTYEADGDNLVFHVDKGSNTDLAHYFHEGMIYGPNFFVKKIGEWRSPKGKQKYPNGKMLKQGQWRPAGVYHWTEGIMKNSRRGPLYQEYKMRLEEILLRKR